MYQDLTPTPPDYRDKFFKGERQESLFDEAYNTLAQFKLNH